MYLGRPFIFLCDFCTLEFRSKTYGLPKGMMYIPSNMLTNKPLRHICADCIKKNKHGDEKLKKSGEL